MTPVTSRMSDSLTDPWNWWDTFRTNLNYDKRVGLVLQVTKEELDERKLKRWLGEPVKALVVDTGLFLTNKKGYPVLPRALQSLIREFVHLDVQVIIEGRARSKDNYLIFW